MSQRTTVIVVENLPVPADRHVWQQALALQEAGWKVLVISPTGGKDDLLEENLDGIEIFRHPLYEARSNLGYVREYVSAIWHESRILLNLYRRFHFDVLHACNPPDIILLFTSYYKILGVKFVFDQHDLAPEIMEVRSGRGFFYWLLRLLEKISYFLADGVLASNEAFRKLAVGRGGKKIEEVHVVHTVPNFQNLRLVEPDRNLRQERKIVIGYLGIIGIQDGLDHLIRAIRSLIDDHGIVDFQTIIVGDGPALQSIIGLSKQLQLEDHVIFTGFMKGESLWAQLSDFDIGIIPDPINPFNDKITMNKVFEYSALGIPTVSYPLQETRRAMGDVCTYAEAPTPQGLASAIASLIRDDRLRLEKGAQAKALADKDFSWEREKVSLIAAYDRLIPHREFV